VPRDWLVTGEAPLVAQRLTTRYGRVALRLSASSPPTQPPQPPRHAHGSHQPSRHAHGEQLVVVANVTLPDGFLVPAGGVRLRLRVPPPFVGKLSSVRVGGAEWSAFDVAAETVDFSAARLADHELRTAMQSVVATFAA
jgi:hypothetical protein